MNNIVRSVLFTPCNKLNVLEKVISLRPDAIIFDLEDAVGPNEKEIARINLSSFLTNRRREIQSTVTIRVNCLKSTPWGYNDIRMIQNLPKFCCDAVVLPKVDDINTLNQFNSNISKPIWCMIETSTGVKNVDSISSHPSVQAIVFGSNDLSKDLNLNLSITSRLPLLYSMQKCIIAARSSKKMVIDGVYMNIKDLVGFRNDCVYGRELGFDGKTLIHPSQINDANEVFSPSQEEIEHAKRVIEAFNHGNNGVAVLDGKLIESLHVEQAQNVLKFMDKIKLL